MTKLIVKTVLTTLCGVIIAFFLTVGVLFAFSPKTIGIFLENVGSGELAVKYYVKQYDRTDNDGDLIVLLEKADDANAYDVMQEYYGVLVNKDNYVEICNEQDAKFSKVSITFSEYSFINFAVSTYYTKDFKDVLSVLSLGIEKNGYTQNNCVSGLLANCGGQLSKAQLSELKEFLVQKKATIDESKQPLVDSDVSGIDLLLR